MRNLSCNEVNVVCGGFKSSGITGAGGMFSSTNIAAGSRLAGGIGLVYASWQFGQAVGGGINSAYGYGSSHFGGSGSLGSDLYDLFS